MDRLIDRIRRFVQELRRRRVFRVAIVYAGTGFIVLQICDIVFPALHLPEWAMTLVVVLLLVGAPIALIAAWAFEVTPEGVVRVTEQEVPDAERPAHGGKPFTGDAAIVAMLAVIAGLLAYPYVFGSGSESPTSRQESLASMALSTDTPGLGEQSIAVLPFTYLAATDSADYFSLGMTDELLSRLAQIGDLSVIARTSVMQYRETDKTIPEIGTELGVAHVVEGSVQQAGRQVRIQAQLIDARTGTHLWARGFTRPYRNVLGLQNEVARAIAREIEVSLTAADEARLGKAPEVDPEAYDLYLKGIETLEGRTNVADRQAISYLESSIAIDSSFAPAYAQLSIAYTLHAEKASKANRSAKQALRLDPSLSMAYVARGLAQQFYAWDWTGGEQAFRRAIELNPNNGKAYHELAQLLVRLGRFEEALEAEQRALLYSPLSALYRSGLGEIYFFSRRYEQAVAELQKAIDIEPDRSAAYSWLSWIYLYSGKHEKALREWRKSGNSWPLVSAYARMGRRKEALEQIKSMTQGQPETYYRVVWDVASAYSALGQKEQAIDWLERATQSPSWVAPYLRVWPGFDPLRGEPRFQALLKKMELDDASVRAIMERLRAMDGPGAQANLPP